MVPPSSYLSDSPAGSMSDPTPEQIIAAAKNEYDKEFTIGEGKDAKTFQLKDLGYFDYIEFIQLAKPLVTLAATALEMNSKDGEMKVDFNPANIDFDAIIKMCGKELPRMAGIVCRQSQPDTKDKQVAELAKRPQRLIEIVLLQVAHGKMIEEFGGFFQRLTAMVSNLVPTAAAVAMPKEVNADSMTEEIPS
jgi:hypothetical protein